MRETEVVWLVWGRKKGRTKWRLATTRATFESEDAYDTRDKFAEEAPGFEYRVVEYLPAEPSSSRKVRP